MCVFVTQSRLGSGNCYFLRRNLFFLPFFSHSFSPAPKLPDMQMFTFERTRSHSLCKIKKKKRYAHILVCSMLCCLIWQSMQKCVRFVVNTHRDFLFLLSVVSKTGIENATKYTCVYARTSVSFSFLVFMLFFTESTSQEYKKTDRTLCVFIRAHFFLSSCTLRSHLISLFLAHFFRRIFGSRGVFICGFFSLHTSFTLCTTQIQFQFFSSLF